MKSYFLRLVAHEAWANRTLLESLKKEMGVAQRARDAFAHICSTPDYWIARVHGNHIKDYEWWPKYDPAELERRIASNEKIWTDYLNSLSEPVDEVQVDTVNHLGEKIKLRPTDILTQYHDHSCHHRGQIAVLYREAGIDPVSTDFIVWVRTAENKS